MKTPKKKQDVLVFGTDEERQKSRRSYIFMMKLTLVPLVTIMGLTSGMILANAGLPGVIGLVCSLVLMVALPWWTWRALNRRLRFWFALRPDGLVVGPGKRPWSAPYDEVVMIRESHDEEMEEPYLEVTAGPGSAKVLMNRDVRENCVAALARRCRCAIVIDSQGKEHPPLVLENDPDSELGQRAVQNLEVLRQRYRQSAFRLGVAFLVCVACLLFMGAAHLGLVQMSAEARRGFTIAPIFFSALFGYACADAVSKVAGVGPRLATSSPGRSGSTLRIFCRKNDPGASETRRRPHPCRRPPNLGSR